MRKLKEFDAPLILVCLTLVIVGAATIATYLVGKDTLVLPLAILFPTAHVVALATAFVLIRMRFGRFEGSRPAKSLRGASMGNALSNLRANSRNRKVE